MGDNAIENFRLVDAIADTVGGQSCLCGSASDLPPDKPHSAATRPQPACARSRRGPHVTPSVPEAAFPNGEIQEAYLVSHPRALATAIKDRAQMADQACIRVTMTSFDQDSIRGGGRGQGGFGPS
jgi:hypothetical protein